MSEAATPWQVYRRLLRFARPYRPLLVIAGIGMLFEAASAAAFTKLMEPVVDETFIDRNSEFSLVLPVAIVALFLLRGVAGYITDIHMAKSGRGIARDLRVQRSAAEHFDAAAGGRHCRAHRGHDIRDVRVDAHEERLRRSTDVCGIEFDRSGGWRLPTAAPPGRPDGGEPSISAWAV